MKQPLRLIYLSISLKIVYIFFKNKVYDNTRQIRKNNHTEKYFNK